MMEFSSILILLCSVVTLQLFQSCESTTVVVDGVSQWNNPHLQIGDSVIFEHKNQYRLYIFRNREAFALCNFTQATLLTKPNSTSYIWHISRPGFFYFAFNNGSSEACLQGQKLAVEVESAAAAAPPMSGGGSVASSPAFPWPFQPRESGSRPTASPAPGPGLSDREGTPIPFISSNPAVPLPTGEVDSATIRPLPTSDHQKVVGYNGVERGLICVMWVIMMV